MQTKTNQIKQFLTDSTLYRCCPAMTQGKKVSLAASSDIERKDDNSLRLTKPCRDSIVYQLFGTGTHYKCNYEWGVSRCKSHHKNQARRHIRNTLTGLALIHKPQVTTKAVTWFVTHMKLLCEGVRVCTSEIYLWVFVTLVIVMLEVTWRGRAGVAARVASLL